MVIMGKVAISRQKRRTGCQIIVQRPHLYRDNLFVNFKAFSNDSDLQAMLNTLSLRYNIPVKAYLFSYFF